MEMPKVRYYINFCEHENYLGSVKCDGTMSIDNYVDVYLFKDEIMGTMVCIRYGNEPHEYSSMMLKRVLDPEVFSHYGNAIIELLTKESNPVSVGR